MSVKLKPLGDGLVIELLEADEVTTGGVLVPEIAREKPLEGIVLVVGPGRLCRDNGRLPMDVEVGDRVLFSKYAGVELRWADQDILILPESDVLATVQG